MKKNLSFCMNIVENWRTQCEIFGDSDCILSGGIRINIVR